MVEKPGLALKAGKPQATDNKSSQMRAISATQSARLQSARLQQSQASGSGSKIPYGASASQASSLGPAQRPVLDRQPQSWTYTSSSSSGRAVVGAAGPAQSAKQPRGVLRRKRSNIAQETEGRAQGSLANSRRTSSSSSVPRSQNSLDAASSAGSFDRGLTESPLEVRVAHQVEVSKAQASPVRIYPELDRYRDNRISNQYDSGTRAVDEPYRLTTQDLPPPTPSWSGTSSQISGVSGSPSTRFSESPGPGPYSRDTTPTSISSYSPGLVAPMRNPTARLRQGSPALSRPPVSGRMKSASGAREADGAIADPAGLPAVRESLTSSSSNSTVRNAEKEARKKKKKAPPIAPNPPPRKSSQKFKKPTPENPSTIKTQEAPRNVAPSPELIRRRGESPVALSPPPARPSRDGTPDLSQLGLPLPIIHSNLSSSSINERRQSFGLAPSAMGRSVTPLSYPDRSQTSTRLAPGRQPTPVQTSATSTKPSEPTRVLRTPSPSVSGFKSRFPLFGRKAKAAVEAPQVESKEKSTRKGPAAGTGHEGYGRIGAVRRRSSGILTRGIAGTMSSQESLAGQDPFLSERTQPVVISGGEVIENRNTSSELSRTESNFSLPFSRNSMESRNESQVSLPVTGSRRRPSDSSDSEALAMKSTLAFRRSVLKAPHEQSPARLPRPIVTQRQGIVSPSATSLDTTLLSDDSVVDRGRPRAIEAAVPTVPKKLVKREKSPRKWNLFGRSQSRQKDAKTVAATVNVVQARPVAFYTMMDSSEQEEGSPIKVEDVLREAAALPAAGSTAAAPESRLRRASVTRNKPLAINSDPGPAQSDAAAQRTARTPAQPSTASTSRVPQATVSSIATAQQDAALSRPSRLAQVGRIPKVISARAEPPSPRSFSRPFNRLSMQVPPSPNVIPSESEWMAKGPTSQKLSTPELTQDDSTVTGGTSDAASRFRQSKELTPDTSKAATKEFLAFSPRQSSLMTTNTTSSGSGSLLPAFADATAVIPAANAPLVEDEIWDEYNDLLGDETLKVPPSAGSSQGGPFHLEIYGDRLKKQIAPALESPTIQVHMPTQSMDDALAVEERVPVASSVYSADMTAKLNEALEDAANPTTPFSLSEFVSGYEGGPRTPNVQEGRESEGQQQQDYPTTMAQRPRESRVSGSSQSSSDDNSPLSQVNLRVGSMTVSKWLTFGHVLFSPVREELIPTVGSLKRHSILVVDGLGNDDWSFYAAETYPAATFFNLSPRAPLPDDHRTSTAFPLSPPNHHQIQYLTHTDKFPFGPQSFTSVVYRFPAAGPESHYRNVISEARRVLKPGGFIELSMLDADLNNMGNRGRRTIRQLKERIHKNAPDTSLSSTADLMLRLLGRRGFVDIKTCRVGVPVASVIPKSSGSEAGSAEIAIRGARSGIVNNAPAPRARAKAKKDDRSLAEMMSDESPVADESITKMVAKVGRWWYSKCYESAAAPDSAETSPRSIWTDPALLAECEEWGTSFKLMVCHARLPDGPRTRVASV
jgi:hypothetical protein